MSQMKDIAKKGVYTPQDFDEAVDTIVEAANILKDPELMKNLKEHAEARSKDLDAVRSLDVTSIQDLRDKANSFYEEPEEKPVKKSKKAKKKPKNLKELSKMAEEKNSKEEDDAEAESDE